MTAPTAPADDITLPAELAAALDRMDALLDPALDLLTAGPDSATAKGSRDDMRTIRNAIADRASPSRAAWIDVAARLPEPGKAVLLDIGKKTPIRALWAAKATVEAGADADESWVASAEASGTTYCPEGWYEWNEHEETHWAVSATPLRWMSIPVPAAVDVGAAQAETALRQVLDVTRRYLLPGGIDMEQAIAEIIGIVDPWPLGRLEKKS